MYTVSSEAGLTFRSLPDGRHVVGVNLFLPPTARSPDPPTWSRNTTDPRRAEVAIVRNPQPAEVDIVLPNT